MYLTQIRSTDDRVKIEAISNGAGICEKWTDMVEKFTTLFWPHHSVHPWNGGSFLPEKCSRIGQRLRYPYYWLLLLLHRSKIQPVIFVLFRQIGELRAQYRQLTRLLTSNERSGLGADTLMQCFDVKGISVFYHHLFIAKKKKKYVRYISIIWKLSYDQYTMKTQR